MGLLSYWDEGPRRALMRLQKCIHYLLVLNPSYEELRNKIMKSETGFLLTSTKPAQRWQANRITLNFLQYQLMEERLVNRLHAVAMGRYGKVS